MRLFSTTAVLESLVLEDSTSLPSTRIQSCSFLSQLVLLSYAKSRLYSKYAKTPKCRRRATSVKGHGTKCPMRHILNA